MSDPENLKILNAGFSVNKISKEYMYGLFKTNAIVNYRKRLEK